MHKLYKVFHRTVLRISSAVQIMGMVYHGGYAAVLCACALHDLPVQALCTSSWQSSSAGRERLGWVLWLVHVLLRSFRSMWRRLVPLVTVQL